MTGGWDRLTPEGEKFFRQIDELQDKEVFVGFQAGKVTDDRGVDMAQIAMWNELGTSTAPSRPFLRKSVDENADPINAMCAQQQKSITAGGTAEHSEKQIGVSSTTRMKNSDKPLIDTGKMRQSVKYGIRKKGSG